MKSRRTFRIILFSLLGLIVLLTSASIYITKLARRKFDSSLTKAGITIQDLHINLLTRSITLEGFDWRKSFPNRDSSRSPSDSSSMQLTASLVRASGVDVYALLRHKRIEMQGLTVLGGRVHVALLEVPNDNKQEPNKRTSSPSKPFEVPFQSLLLSSILLDDIEIVVRRDSLTEHSGNLTVKVKDLQLKDASLFKDLSAYGLRDFAVKINNYRMAAKNSMYTLRIGQLNVDSDAKEIIVDSVVLLPKYGKYQFSRKIGRQFDRFVLRVPKVTLSGVDFSKITDSMFVASYLRIDRANLHVFRDKRLPFIKHKNTPLPIALVRSLPYGFALDSLRITDATITYEEFPEKGFKTGHIVFNDLNAYVARLTNRDFYADHSQSVLHVNSGVMDQGVIGVDFTLPYGKSQIYNAKGRISNLRMAGLNPLLESLAFVKVESGRLNALDFDFDYDEYTSRGNILINYENLKLTALKKEPDAKENDIKSLALGIFLKKDKDRAVPLEKRTGKVYYERDRRRAVFNVWVKSLMSGVKSSVVDAPAVKKPLSRKERRDSLRDVRKAKKEKKRKERRESKKEEQSAAQDSVRIISRTH